MKYYYLEEKVTLTRKVLIKAENEEEACQIYLKNDLSLRTSDLKSSESIQKSDHDFLITDNEETINKENWINIDCIKRYEKEKVAS